MLMSDDTELFEPTACALTAAQARNLAFELLVCAEHAERLTSHYQENERCPPQPATPRPPRWRR